MNGRLEAKRLFRRILEPSIVGRLAIPLLEAAFDVDRRAAALDDFAVRSRGGFQRHERKCTTRNRSRVHLFSERNPMWITMINARRVDRLCTIAQAITFQRREMRSFSLLASRSSSESRCFL